MSEQSKIWDAFSSIYCLTQASRPDRWDQARQEFKRVEMENVIRFLSLPADTAAHSFCLSQYAMLKTFLKTEGTTLLALEDDVVFFGVTRLQDAMAELQGDWDVVYLGANITDMVFGIKDNPPVKHSDHLCRIRRAWMTHAVAYSRKAVESIVTSYPVDTYEMYDNWLSERFLPYNNCFIVNPMVAWQRPGKSDLWGCMTDYSGAFAEGNKIITR